MNKINYNNFSLVLSGGGALGIAHLGVISDLEAKSMVPSEIIGTSMGSIIGASLSIGMSEKDIYTLIEEFSNVFKWIRFSLRGNSIIKTAKIEKIFYSIFGNTKIKDTLIPLKIVATNLANGDAKIFDDDTRIVDALLCSMAIPGIFEEKSLDGSIFADGFISDNLGVKYTSFDDILAVDVLGRNSFDEELLKSSFKTKNVLNMFERSLRLLIYNQTRKSIEQLVNKSIYLIEPNTKDYKTFQFNRYKEIRNLGKNLIE
ncbi:MAG: putative patatin-like phospholipase [uncultured Campylobacterales bacterium]|uniref:Putative patatin-like phospholipase n=1 Tax=uncultured Campylobacterales bacterium TaxID=352960 RepID=A0A6S6S7U7_9BACT|nr:MAG: putative patatin-like phospholipase [uncultured Campylobacterales bacterium]